MVFFDDDIKLIDGYEELGRNVLDQAVVKNPQTLVASGGEQLRAQSTVGPSVPEYSIGEKYRSTLIAAKSAEEHDALIEMFKAELAAKQSTSRNFGTAENGMPLSGSDLFNRIKSGNSSVNPDLAKIFMDKVQYNLGMNIGAANPVFINATLSDQDIAYGLHLEYNPNGILWIVNAAGIPTNEDLNNYVEQQRVIEDTANRTMKEIQPLLNTSRGSTAWEEEAKYAIKHGKQYASAGISDMNPYPGEQVAFAHSTLKSGPPNSNKPKYEYLIISGGGYLDDFLRRYNYEFIEPAIKKIIEINRTDSGGSINWIIADSGYSSWEKSKFCDAVAKLPVNVMFIGNVDGIINYINYKETRTTEKIKYLGVFSHGTLPDPEHEIKEPAIDLGYNHNNRFDLRFTREHIGRILATSFDNPFCEFYSCNTGAPPNDGKEIWAQAWVNKVGGTAMALDGRSDYTYIDAGADDESRHSRWLHSFSYWGSTNYPIEGTKYSGEKSEWKQFSK